MKTVTIRLEEDLTIERAVELKSRLLADLERGEEILLDLGEARSVDASFLQLLCAAHRTASRAGRRFRFSGPVPGVVSRQLRTAGFDRHVGCALDCQRSCLWAYPADSSVNT